MTRQCDWCEQYGDEDEIEVFRDDYGAVLETVCKVCIFSERDRVLATLGEDSDD